MKSPRIYYQMQCISVHPTLVSGAAKSYCKQRARWAIQSLCYLLC